VRRKLVRSPMQRAGRRDDVDPTNAGRDERLGARGDRGARGQDVVHQQHALRDIAPVRRERTVHGAPPILTSAARLRPRRHTPDEEPRYRQIRAVPERDRERSRLVVAALGEAAPRERNPRHDLDGRQLVAGRDRLGERARNVAPPRELQPVHGPARGPLVQERRAGDRHRRGRTVAARGDRHRRRAPAPPAPRRNQRDELVATRVAEGPDPRAAARAAPWEHDVERTAEHGPTLAGRADTPTAARSPPLPRPARRSKGAPAREGSGRRRSGRDPIPRRDRPRAPGGERRRP
jgi:hypothetical protein